MFIAGGGVRYSEAGPDRNGFLQGVQHSVSRDPGPPFLPPAGFVRAGCRRHRRNRRSGGERTLQDCDLVIGVGTRFNDFVTGSKWVLFRNPDIEVLAINTSEFHAKSWMQPAASATQGYSSDHGRSSRQTAKVRLHRKIWISAGFGKKSVCAFWAFSTRGEGLRRGQSSYRAFPAGPRRS